MPEAPEIDVDQLMERIRETSGKRRSAVPPPNAGAILAGTQMPADIASLQSSGNLYHIDFTSHRKVAGRLVVFVKNLLRQLLTPILERQSAFNTATARAATCLWEQLAEAQRRVEEIHQQQVAAVQTLRQESEALGQRQIATLEALRAEMREHIRRWDEWGQHIEKRLSGLEQTASRLHDSVALLEQTASRLHDSVTLLEQVQHEGITRMERDLHRLKTDHILQERRLTILLEETRRRLPEPLNREQLQVIADESKHLLEAMYVAFEDQFRGTREDIKERLRVYLPFLKGANLGLQTTPILDVGCGRGEWLELLKEEDLQAQGVDQNRVLVEECRRRGFNALEGEAVSYLCRLPQHSLGAVTGFHIIEHLPFELLVRLLDETVRVLKPGGLAIFETPNPENVLVGSHNFYLDPTHRNPLPSATVKFLAEARGLCRVTIMPLHPYPASYEVEDTSFELAQRFNRYFYGPQDYAVMGWKV
jgi:2-polyprenyl-3-methyl-5-hydroxy-6-metoxy-1,4-benzoquinol methylase